MIVFAGFYFKPAETENYSWYEKNTIPKKRDFILSSKSSSKSIRKNWKPKKKIKTPITPINMQKKNTPLSTAKLSISFAISI